MYLLVSTKEPSRFTKIEDRFDEGYGIDGELGPLCDVDNLEYTQHFDEDALPDAVPFDDVENTSDNEGNKYIAEGVDNPNNDSSPPVYVGIL